MRAISLSPPCPGSGRVLPALSYNTVDSGQQALQAATINAGHIGQRVKGAGRATDTEHASLNKNSHRTGEALQ